LWVWTFLQGERRGTSFGSSQPGAPLPVSSPKSPKRFPRRTRQYAYVVRSRGARIFFGFMGVAVVSCLSQDQGPGVGRLLPGEGVPGGQGQRAAAAPRASQAQDPEPLRGHVGCKDVETWVSVPVCACLSLPIVDCFSGVSEEWEEAFRVFAGRSSIHHRRHPGLLTTYAICECLAVDTPWSLPECAGNTAASSASNSVGSSASTITL